MYSKPEMDENSRLLFKLFQRLIKVISIIVSLPIYIVLGFMVALITAIEEGLKIISETFNLWYDTFVEEKK